MGLCAVAKVAVDKAAFHFDRLFSYRLPGGMELTLQKGCRVIVPFGASDAPRQAVVLEITEEDDSQQLKSVLGQIDREPILNDEMLEMVFWLRENTFCTYYEAVRTLLPPGVNMVFHRKCSLLKGGGGPVTDFLEGCRGHSAKEDQLMKETGATREDIDNLARAGYITVSSAVRQSVGDETVKMVRLREGIALQGQKFPHKQQTVLDFVKEYTGEISLKELCYRCVVTKAVVDNLVKKGTLEYYENESFRSPYDYGGDTDQTEIELSQQQQAVYTELQKMCSEKSPSAALLYGVTGSGKTNVYLKLIESVLEQGKQVIVLVPEISLTPQAVKLFYQRFGQRIAVLHSALSMGERYDQYKRIVRGDVSIVVGTRSAIFAPLQNIGLIVMDEEQEATYRSESAPRFHARDVARFRCAKHGCMLLMCSATPSVTSYYYANTGRYRLFEINERFAGAVLPEVYIVDMKDEIRGGNNGSLSGILLNELKECIQKGEQAIILLNRRGYHTLAACINCGEVVKCPRCSIALTYHAVNDSYLCHYCGYMKHRGDRCDKCGSEYIKYQGYGTQKLEEELAAAIPGVRILRMDADTTASKMSHQKLFESFEKRDYDILIGTQMIAKGLDFENVTLAAVLSADNFLYSSDYKSYERAFSLLTQVVGRSGRRTARGKAYIQTFTPDNPIIALAAAQDYKQFYEDEILLRKSLLYPPFCDICVVGFSGQKEGGVKDAATLFMDILKKKARDVQSAVPLRVMGPSPSSLYRLNNKYRYRIVVKCRNNRAFRDMIRSAMEELSQQPQSRGISVFCDMHYEGSI